MRNSRPRGPPSTLSGSSSSGRELVAGPYVGRGPPPTVFVPGDQDKVTAKNRTKIIIILGIALPVLACIIGIAAWAVTTDVLRISPRAHDNPFNKFGHQGKTRIDSLQPRNDQDIDVFQLNDISAKLTTVPPIIMKVVTQKALMKPTSVPKMESVNVKKTSENQKVSDILSRLISDMPIPKNPKDFVVFAPVADIPDEKDMPKGRRLDGKIFVHDDEDLLAEESVHSGEFSQEIPERNTPFSRKRKSSSESSFFKPVDIKSSDLRQNFKLKNNRIPHAMRDNSGVENHPEFLKRQNQNLQIAAPSKSANSVSSHKEGISQSRQNANQPYNTEISIDSTKKQELAHHAVPLKVYQDDRPQREQININTVLNQQQPSNPSQNSRLPPNQVNNAYQIPVGNTPQNKVNNNFLNVPQNLPRSDIQHQSHPPPLDHQRIPLHKSPSYQSPTSAPGRQRFHKPPPILGQNPPVAPNTQPLPSQNHHQYQPREYQQPPPQGNPVSHHQAAQSQGYHSPPPQSPPQYPNQLPSPSSFGNNLPHSSNSMSMDLSNNGPQYFAPPPQTFHTKTSYDRPSSKFSSGSSLSSYERLAQTSVDLGKDGHHHHHHHHHHHEPVPSNSDPVGDVNFSDVPRTNDADRLGTIGVGLGNPRGITVQIGGGGGGGGLTGLLPLGALGIAKNIVASLLPRPTLGLNSKVYLGLEVGRGGGGLSLMG